jgi:hypothetical protein
MKITPLIITIFSCFFATAQIKNFAVSVAPNYSVIPTNTQLEPVRWWTDYTGTPYVLGIKESFAGKIGLDINTTIDFALSKRFFVSSGISLSYLRFDKNLKVILSEDKSSFYIKDDTSDTGSTGVPIGSSYQSVSGQEADILEAPKGDKSTLYVSVPVMAGLSVLKDKLFLRAGCSVLYLLNATQYQKNYSIGANTTIERKENSTKGYHSFLLGTLIQSTFRATKHLGFDISYQHSLTPIYSNDAATKSRYNTFTVGLSYNLSF